MVLRCDLIGATLMWSRRYVSSTSMVLRCGLIGVALMCSRSSKRYGAKGIGIGASLMCSQRYVPSTSMVLRCGLIGATLMCSRSLKRSGAEGIGIGATLMYWEPKEIWREGNWDRCYVDVFSDVCVLNFNGIALWRQHWRGVWFVLLRFA